ncbi:MAG TPA: methyltransferase domain-containing protein [Candidatus Limivivens intestinipullorum]|uniref:Methyltransferase domain-containing protein n=1 Tax=Candidatus Limivivens intestinipullorum TaxID=2840858 RepID=A0A9D1EW84_9FIRM|nr:methyltransferase domain-containing protein [Candidatus Limivivens intestinipullorum]
MIHFKLAELRKRKGLTQQELAEILGVSHQTISRWETGAVLPDVSILPQISMYFDVSVDALLGLVPLDPAYIPSKTGIEEYWDNKLEYLENSRASMWNTDYARFLVQEVWKIKKPAAVLDCGCGYGELGRLLLPLLPSGRKYVGIDFSEKLIRAARKLFHNTDMDVQFVRADIMKYRSTEKYDLVIGQGLLRHPDSGELMLRRMAGFLREGGLLVSIECNRELETSGLYIHGMDYFRLSDHEGLKKLWKKELEEQNRDYAVAMKVPHYMKAMGLKNVSSRMNDRVTFLEPEQPDFKKRLECIVKAEGWDKGKTDAEISDLIAFFMNHGMSRKDAEDYCGKQREIAEYIKSHKESVSMTMTKGFLISYGWK